MKPKLFLQVLILFAILTSSFVTASSAFASAACGTSYTIVRGDTLRIIAARCDTTLYALRRANPFLGSGDLIYPGQSLLLPGAIIYGSDGVTTYIVARGDGLKAIANRFGTTINAIASLNSDITNVNIIYEGQRLIVSGSTVVTPPPVSGSTYTIQRGDTLKLIAIRYGTTVEAILQVNAKITNPNIIYAGQVINLPAAVTTYTVQRGDTLKLIAARFGTSLGSLLALNPKITNADWIYVGQVIRIW